MSQETASYWQSPSSREKNLQKLRAQIHGRGLRQARRGGSLHPAQSQDRQIHHILPLYRQVIVIWNWYKTSWPMRWPFLYRIPYRIWFETSMGLGQCGVNAVVVSISDSISYGLRPPWSWSMRWPFLYRIPYR